MKAVRFHAHGGPDVLRYEDAADPIPGPGEALVRVRACALNHLDLWQRRGMERVQIPFPHISGADVAGEVISTPDGEFGAGRRVMLQPGLSCARCAACLDGRDNECAKYDVLGYRSDGGYAEIVRVPVQNLIAIPDSIGFVEAAAFPLAFLTAWHMLITRAKLHAGEDVLVLGAGSGVGQAAIQIAWRHGARVFATAGTDEKLAKARQLGAYEVINHTTQDLPAKVREFTNGRGVDVVVRARRHGDVGPQPQEPDARRTAGHVRRDDRPRCADRSARALHAPDFVTRFLHGPQGGAAAGGAVFLCRRAAAGRRSTFPLAEAAEAHRRLESREQFGKLVLVV